jgi:prepilin-type N-terminal cleavage/methylation domain-containing protein
MLMIGKTKMKNGFTLIEILVSLAIFSAIITTVLGITMSMVNAERKIQAELFLASSAQTTLESMSRQIRYGYNYSGNSSVVFEANLKSVVIDSKDISNTTGSSASTTQNLINAQNSPFLLFESQGGNPNTFTDQNAFCAVGGKLYKISNFSVDTDGTTFRAACTSGSSMLPDDITLESISFDVYGDSSENPKNPMVRIKMRLSHPDGGALDVQSTVTQRLVSYF